MYNVVPNSASVRSAAPVMRFQGIDTCYHLKILFRLLILFLSFNTVTFTIKEQKSKDSV